MQQHFAQLSDPHLTTLEQIDSRELYNKRALGYLSWRRKRRHEHRREVLDALQRDLEGRELEQLLITGDLTHIGLPTEFQQARDWLQLLGAPSDVAVVPGNHDTCVQAPWEDTFALWQDYIAGDTPPAVAHPEEQFPTLRVRGALAFIGVCTGVPKPPLLATGTAGQQQLNRLATMLRTTGEKGLFRVVYLHHCPLKGQEKWRKRLTDAQRTQRVLEQNGAELVLHGHGHRRHFSLLGTCDGTAPVIAVPSASALGLHGADVARYNCYSVSKSDTGWRLEINSRIYQSATQLFADDESSFIELVRRQP